MATAAQAIERIAEVTGLLPATVFRAARFMREADPTLWPMGEKGRGRAAQVYPSHLVNLALSIGYDEPATAAAEVVPMLRSLRPWINDHWKWQARSLNHRIQPQPAEGDVALPAQTAASPFTAPPGSKSACVYDWTKRLIASGALPERLQYLSLPGETLGDALDNLVDYLTRPEGAVLKAEIETSSIEVDIHSGGIPSATIGYQSFEVDGSVEYYVQNTYLMASGSFEKYKPRQAHAITRTARLHGGLFLCLAELWADTQKRPSKPKGSGGGGSNSQVSSEVTSGTSSETKAATTSPGRLEVTALDQSWGELGGVAQTHPNGERENSQSPSFWAGRFLHHDRSDPYAQSRGGGAYCVTA